MLNIGILGAGYIADPHVKALKKIKNLCIAGICDLDKRRAERLAQNISFAKIYPSLDEMLSNERWDVIHVLTPPDQHYNATKKILEAGIHVFIEKPMAILATECQILCQTALQYNLKIGVNHNFLFFSSYQLLKNNIKKKVGAIDHITIRWQHNLDQIKNGPFGIWMLREPKNIWLETGPHICAILVDLIDGESEILSVHLDRMIELPTSVNLYREWRISGKLKNTTFEILLSLTPGFEEKNVVIRGKTGIAKVDFLRNGFTVNHHTQYSLPFDNYFMTKQETTSLTSQNWKNLEEYIKSKVGLSAFGDPYVKSIYGSIFSFYKNLGDNETYVNSGTFGWRVIELCEKIINATSLQPLPLAPKNITVSLNPEILVLGGSGYIGFNLVQYLLDQGKKVRVLVRDPSKFNKLSQRGMLEIMVGDILDPLILQKAFKNIQYVFHLATARVKSWKDYLTLDLEPTKIVANACLEYNIKKLIYTGTIDSFYGGRKGEVISENTPLDQKIHKRNYYAQAKAISEEFLLSLHRTKMLPVVIVRPGIVIGEEGNPCHWGVGMWHYDTVCQLWGEGNNPLPLVLVKDVVKGLYLTLEKDNIEGQAFNLVDNPCITALEYLEAMENAFKSKLTIYAVPIWRYFILDCFKWMIKIMVGHKERRLPSWRDWATRSQLATYDCTKAKSLLGWKPEGTKQIIVEEGVTKPTKWWWS